MEGADVWQTQMDASTNLTEALLRGASVRFVDYTTVDFSQSQIDSMFGDGSITLPDHVTRPAHWPTRELDPGEFQTEYAKWRTSPSTYTPPD